MRDAPSTELELVSFDRPPVEEIAFAVQLAEPQLSLEDMVDVGRLLSSRFPVRQLQAPLPRMTESMAPLFTIGVPLPRFWFVSSDGLRVVQVQEDRVAFNWRRLGTDAAYPRYAALRAEFKATLELMAPAVPGLAGGHLRADFCELTYVNELETPGADASILPLESVLSVVRSVREFAFLPPPDHEQWMGSWTIADPTGAQTGRLTAGAQPALRQRDQRPIYLLTMTGALAGEVSGVEAAFDRLDVAHEWIVRGFADLTTKEMHDHWGRTR
jgi:uncharacterized protein (TIGR04255 family)